MLIYLISCVFPPEPNISAQTSHLIAAQLSKEGHRVLVITSFPSRPLGTIFPGYRRRLFSSERVHEGVSILRCFSFFSPRSTLVSRFLENISFGLTSGLALFFSPRPDILYMNTWPIFAGGIIRLIAGWKHLPLITHIKDLYPESLASQGRVKEGGLLYTITMQLDGWIARGCNAVIVISEYFARRYDEFRHVDPIKIHVIYDWVDPGSEPQFSKQSTGKKGVFHLMFLFLAMEAISASRPG
jgi:colanic acid biosynthesis glycosyl transferase WcaI